MLLLIFCFQGERLKFCPGSANPEITSCFKHFLKLMIWRQKRRIKILLLFICYDFLCVRANVFKCVTTTTPHKREERGNSFESKDTFLSTSSASCNEALMMFPGKDNLSSICWCQLFLTINICLSSYSYFANLSI